VWQRDIVLWWDRLSLFVASVGKLALSLAKIKLSSRARARLQRPARVEATIEDSTERDPRCPLVCYIHSAPCAPLPLALVLFTRISHNNLNHNKTISVDPEVNHLSILDCHYHCRHRRYIDHHTYQQLNRPTPTQHSTRIMSTCQQSLARPQPQPQQNRTEINSDGSISSTPSSNSGRGSMHNIFSSPEIARCSRCHRTPSIDITTGKSNMVQYGLNQYYCSRCAGMVGYYSR